MGLQTLLAAGIVILISGTHVTEACSCIPGSRPTIPEVYDRAKSVFKGTVTRQSPDPDENPNALFTYRLKVLEVWKGNPGNHAVVQSRNSAACGFTFVVGMTYIVYEEKDGSVNGFCNGRTSSPTPEHEAILDELAGSTMPDCVQTRPPFDAGYGPCPTYAKGNSNFCGSDFVRDGGKRVFADDACSECGKCTGTPSPGPICVKSDMDFDAGYGDCSTYAEGRPNHDYCREDKAHRACAECGYVFRTQYGGCSTYAEGEPNHEYCSEDSDRRTGIVAIDACPECGMCTFGGGQCPKPTGAGPCVERCNPVTNQGCDSNKGEKCCSNGCGHTCRVVY